MDFLQAVLRTTSLIKSLKVSDQWPVEVWWCPGRLLDCMPPTKFWYWAVAWSGHC